MCDRFSHGHDIRLSLNSVALVESKMAGTKNEKHHQPKNRSMALLTMPELRLGVVGVPVIFVALCVVL